jgi:subtilisin family serine protease
MPPTIVTNVDIHRPYVKRSPAANDAVDSLNLPFGVELTGGKALREKGLTGKGVRVAVIDSGVDETHEEFNGCVKQQLWFRSGTSLKTDGKSVEVLF